MIKSLFARVKGLGWRQQVRLLLIVGAAVFAARTLHGQRTLLLPNTLQDFITLTLGIFVEAFPFIVLGSLLAALVRVFVSHSFLIRRLPKRSLARRFVLSLLGFLFPVCECGNVPLSRALLIKGLKPSDAITFLLAAPVLNPITIWSTSVAFGGDAVIVVSRVLATLFIANLIGWVISRARNQDEFLTQEFSAVCEASNDEKPIKKSRAANVRSVSHLFNHEAVDMTKMLVIGALVAGAVQTFIPRGALVSIGGNAVLAIGVMLLLAFVVSICANVDAFFALSFAQTFTTGSIVAFLVFGPMIDIKMLSLLRTTFTVRLLVIISTLSLLLSALTGLVVTYVA